MAIDTSGTWWVGSDKSDVSDYLNALTDGKIDQFRAARCNCSSDTFEVDFDGDAGCVRRKCGGCHATSFVCDSAEQWPSASPERYECVACGSKTANVVIGFTLRPATLKNRIGFARDVKWVFVGVRCDRCGVLGCVADWKINYLPSAILVTQV